MAYLILLVLLAVLKLKMNLQNYHYDYHNGYTTISRAEVITDNHYSL